MVMSDCPGLIVNRMTQCEMFKTRPTPHTTLVRIVRLSEASDSRVLELLLPFIADSAVQAVET